MMKRILWGLLLLATGQILVAQTITKSGIDAVVEDEMIKQELVGLAVGIIQNGRVTHLKGYGYADRERKRRMTTKTPIRWASISKVLTAVAAYQLIQDGKLSDRDKVSKYLPATTWPQNGDKKNITILNLLQHRSGINHYGNGKDDDDDGKYDRFLKGYSANTTTWDAKKSVAMFKDAPLDFKPGSDFLYTTYGYNLLGAVVDEIYPKGYQQFVYDKIKKPLGMSSLAPSINKWEGYYKDCHGAISKKTGNGKMAVLPGGGWISDVNDVTKFVKALVNGDLLRFMPLLKGHADNEDGYRSGMQQFKRCGKTIIGHGGTHNNLRTAFYYYAGTKDAIVLMSNGAHTDRAQLFRRIANAIGKGCSSTYEATNSLCDPRACSQSMAAIWKKSSTDVIIRRGYKTTDFYREVAYLEGKGYYAKDIESYNKNGQLHWDGIFSKTNVGIVKYGKTKDQFNSTWKDLSAKQYRLIDIERYKNGTTVLWAGVFVKGSGKYALYRNYGTSSFVAKRQSLAAKDYKLIDVEAYEEGGQTKWTGVWRQKLGTSDIKFDFGKSRAQFRNLIATYKHQGYQMLDIEPYRYKGKTYWSGIWEKSARTRVVDDDLNFCQLLFQNKERPNYEAQGYEVFDIEHY